MLVTASPTAMRPEAGRVEQRDRRALADRHRLARSGREGPTSSPRRPLTGTCQGPTSGSRLIMPPTVRSPIVIRKVLSATAGSRSSALAAPRAASSAAASNPSPPARCASPLRCMRGGLPSSASIGMSTARSPNCGSCTTQPPVVGRARRSRRRGSARGGTAPRTRRAARPRSRARSAPAPRCTRSRAATCRARRSARRAGRCARRAAVRDDLGHRVRQAAGADVVDHQDRDCVAQRPAGVDDFLRAALHLRIAALHRGEVELLAARAAAHATTPRRRRGRSASPDRRARTSRRAAGTTPLLDVHAPDVAEAARDHDRLVIAAHDRVGVADDALLEACGSSRGCPGGRIRC